MPELSIQLNHHYGELNLALNTRIPLQGVTALYGPSGSGKTSLLRCIAGLDKGNGETTVRFGEECWQDKERFVAPHERGVAYVFQEARLFTHRTVLQNLEYALKRRTNGNTGPELEQVIRWCGIEALLNQRPATLSGGQKQRVAIARALCSAPRLLLMDEPLGALDDVSRKEILPYLEQLYSQLGIPIIYVSHNLEEVSHLADHLLLLEQGKLSAEGSFIELCSRLDSLLAKEDNGAAILECTASKKDEDSSLLIAELAGSSNGNPQYFYLATPNITLGSHLRVRVPARDVSISLSKATDSSILNILAATVDQIEELNDIKVLVRLRIGEQYLLAQITRKSATLLKLKPEQSVYAQIKTVALLNETIPHA